MTDGRPVRVLHSMARSGGTLVSKCLGCMDGVVLLSEIHPLGLKWAGPIAQAVKWFGLLEPAEVDRYKLERGIRRLDFVQQIGLIEQRCAELGKTLVIRDWTHLDFIALPFLSEPTFEFSTVNALEDSGGYRTLRAALTRHPVDQWLSFSRLMLAKGRVSLQAYLSGYRRYAEACPEIGFVRYEDFTQDPARTLKTLCGMLAIEYDGSFESKWFDYGTITGDIDSKRGAAEITPMPRRETPAGLLEAFESSADYRRSIELLGYDHPQ